MGLFFQNAVITSIRAAYKVYTSPPGVSFRPRTSHGFVFYLEGSCRYVYPDRTFTAEANTFLYLPKGVAYAIEPQGDSVCLLINFDTADPPAEKAFCRLYPNASQIRDRFYAAVSEGRQKKAGHVPELSLIHILQSLYSLPEEKEYIWQPGAEIFDGHAPILFPAAGRIDRSRVCLLYASPSRRRAYLLRASVRRG